MSPFTLPYLIHHPISIRNLSTCILHFTSGVFSHNPTHTLLSHPHISTTITPSPFTNNNSNNTPEIFLRHVTYQMYSSSFSSKYSTRALQEANKNHHLNIQPKHTLTKFKLCVAILQSTAIYFPQAQHKRCLFHFAEAIICRKVKSLRLQPPYQQNAESHSLVQSIITLPFVTPQFIRMAWAGFLPDIPDFSSESCEFSHNATPLQ